MWAAPLMCVYTQNNNTGQTGHVTGHETGSVPAAEVTTSPHLTWAMPIQPKPLTKQTTQTSHTCTLLLASTSTHARAQPD